MRIITIIAYFVSLSFSIVAQELNCQVTVQSNPALDVTTTEKEIFTQLQQTVFELMNNTAWTKDEFEVEERVNCIMLISITAIPSTGNYQATMQVQSTRPVYNTTYNTTVFNFLDEDVNFSFRRNARLQFTENQFVDNLTSVLAFYAYYILGLDADTYAKNGGDPYFAKAQNIVTLSQSGGGAGWRASEKGRRNRYWLIENQLQELFSPLRICLYEYHRDGLDKMYDDQEKAREKIFKSLQKLQSVNSARPGSVNVLNILQAKLQELKNVYREAQTRQKNDVVGLLKRLDPANSSKYQEILE